MSHNEVIQGGIGPGPDSIGYAKKAAAEMGGVLEEASTFNNWYHEHGKLAGDYPIPAGYREDEMDKCQYKIRFPGIKYEVGIVKSKSGAGYDILYDFWDSNLKAKMGGKRGEKFIQTYGLVKAEASCRMRGIMTQRVQLDGRVRLEMRGGVFG